MVQFRPNSDCLRVKLIVVFVIRYTKLEFYKKRVRGYCKLKIQKINKG